MASGGAGAALAAKFRARTACSEYGSFTALGDVFSVPLAAAGGDATGAAGGGALATRAFSALAGRPSPMAGTVRNGAVVTPFAAWAGAVAAAVMDAPAA